MQHMGYRSASRPWPVTPRRLWRDGTAYAQLKGIDRAGLMWEWLRRDPDYVAWHARASAVTRGHANPLPWGLHFR